MTTPGKHWMRIEDAVELSMAISSMGFAKIDTYFQTDRLEARGLLEVAFYVLLSQEEDMPEVLAQIGERATMVVGRRFQNPMQHNAADIVALGERLGVDLASCTVSTSTRSSAPNQGLGA